MKQKINDIKKRTKEKKKQNAGSASTKLCLKHPYIPTRQKKGGKQSCLSLSPLWRSSYRHRPADCLS